MIEQHWASIEQIRASAPLVHNITNYVVMNTTANALLALGASPLMAHAPEELDELVTIAGALVVNIGTLSSHWIAAMRLAAQKAGELGKPWVLDPVGVGASRLRTATAASLLALRPTVVRGNGSEILALAGGRCRARRRLHQSSSASIDVARALAKQTGSVIAVDGAIDTSPTAAVSWRSPRRSLMSRRNRPRLHRERADRRLPLGAASAVRSSASALTVIGVAAGSLLSARTGRHLRCTSSMPSISSIAQRSLPACGLHEEVSRSPALSRLGPDDTLGRDPSRSPRAGCAVANHAAAAMEARRATRSSSHSHARSPALGARFGCRSSPTIASTWCPDRRATAHVGQSDLNVSRARAMLGPDALNGLSIETASQVA